MGEFVFCKPCQRNENSRHFYTKKHKEQIKRCLLKSSSKIKQIVALYLDKTAKLLDNPSQPFWCIFCEIEVSADAGEFPGEEILAHLSSKPHRSSVFSYCKAFKGDPERTIREDLVLSRAKFAKFKANCELDSKHDKTLVNPYQFRVENKAAEEFLSCATNNLQEFHRASNKNELIGPSIPVESTMGPQISITNKEFNTKTLVSDQGILQNALGRHQGTRVWGGGIIKIRKSKWISWKIDLLYDLEEERKTNIPQSNSCVITEASHGLGLTSIKLQKNVEIVGNIHSGAVPPWLVSSEEYIKSNIREKCKKSIVNEGSNDSTERVADNWLPNFGGVWNSGSRSDSKRKFQQQTQSSRSSKSFDNRVVGSKSKVIVNKTVQGRNSPTLRQQNEHSKEVHDIQKPNVIVSDKTDILAAKKLKLQRQKEALRAKMMARNKRNV